MSTNNNNKNVTQSGDVLGKFDVYGTDGDNRVLAGSIEFQADGDATAGAVGSKLVIKTATASGVLTNALVIDKTQAATTSPTRAKQLSVPICGNAKVGATAGWVITAGTNIAHATLPASQTGSTLVIPISGLEIGDTLTAVDMHGQVESAGNVASTTISIRKITTAAAAITDAELGTDQASFAADTIMSGANLGVSGLTEVLAANESLYVLLTATTAASTDIDLTHMVVSVTRAA